MIWKDIDTNPNYEVSDTGEVRKKISNKKLSVDRDGYLYTTLTTQGKSKTCRVHRLVLHAFCPIENEDEMEVHHKDGNRQNNSIENLEWVTRQENDFHVKHTGESQKIRVNQYDLKHNLLKTFSSMAEAEKLTGCSSRHIGQVCNGKRKTCGGFYWEKVESSTTTCSHKCDEMESFSYENEDIV